MGEPEKTFYRPDEIARMLNVKPSTVRSWIRRGILSVIRLPGGRTRIPWDELARITASKTNIN